MSEILALDEADVLSRTWSFGKEGHPTPYAPYLKLLPGGVIGGHPVETERRWDLQDGRLVIYDSRDRRSCVFKTVGRDAEGRLRLTGPFLLLPQGEAVHYLQEIPAVGEPVARGGDLQLLSRPGGRRRPNLMVVRANAASAHLTWARDIGDADRNWDLCNSFYGEPEQFGQDPVAEHQVLQRGPKNPSLHALFHEGSPLWDYEHIALFDDDIWTSWETVNALFAICRAYDLLLAQPALTADSFISHPITMRDERCLLRFTSFVEVMCPVFTSGALRACLPSFPVAAMGFGLDNVWPKLIGEPPNRIAIIDRTPVLHSRPLASGYDLAAAVENGNALQRMFNAPSRVLEFGAILAEPIDRQRQC